MSSANVAALQALSVGKAGSKAPVPKPERKKFIPSKSFAVQTQNSRYELGPADENGERTITKKGGTPLYFDRCRVLSVAIGRSMMLTSPGAIDGGYHTSPVVSLDVNESVTAK